MSKIHVALRGISAVILDMDGVLYRGDRPIKGAAEAVDSLRRSGKKVIFLTNNSECSRPVYLKKLARMGIPAADGDVVTSGQVAADYVRKRSPDAKVFVIGGEGLVGEIRDAGLEIVSPEKATHLVVGIDQSLTYEKLRRGLQTILSGAEFVATNPDTVYPTENGLSPGAGSIIAALERSSGRKPDVVIGKPSPHTIKFVLRAIGKKPKETAIIGDQVETDIKAGKRTGLMTILVLSGVTRPEDAKRWRGSRNAPDFIINSLKGVMN